MSKKRKKRKIDYRTYVIAKHRKCDMLDSLSLLGGDIYADTVRLVRKTQAEEDRWLKASEVKSELKNRGYPCQSHSVQAIVDDYFFALGSYFKRVKKDKTSRPPYKTRKYHSFRWRASGIKYEDGKLRLSMGVGREYLWVEIDEEYHDKVPSEIGLVYNINDYTYEFHATYEVSDVKTVRKVPESKQEKKISAVDLGEIHPITSYDGEVATLYNGRMHRHIVQYRNKFLAEINRALSFTKRYSRKWKRLKSAKRSVLLKISNQLKDMRHKITSRYVSTCVVSGVQTIVIGDVAHIRRSAKYSKKSNQKIHQWPFSIVEHMTTYKAEAIGIEVTKENEAYTSQECPRCRHRKKPWGRTYKCSKCGWEGHRDAVGASNIFRKHKASGSGDPVIIVGNLAIPEGVRFHPHLRRLDSWSPHAGLISSKRSTRT